MKLENVIDQSMAIAAFRYCLGRQSYIVGACIEWLSLTWPQFDQNTKRVIVRDIVEALMRGEAGLPSIDVHAWQGFAKVAWEDLEDADRGWVIRETAHIEKEWPLDVDGVSCVPRSAAAYEKEQKTEKNTDWIYYHCPRCGNTACIERGNDTRPSPVEVVCPSCSVTKEEQCPI